jgi:RNA polymerase sigma-70 factor (ECF subfamily)
MPKRTAQMPDPPGDHGDLAEIFKRHEASLHRRAMALTGAAQTADDLVQDTYVRATERFPRFEQGTNAGAWLMTILTNLFFDRLKHDRVIAKAIPDLLIHFGFVEGDQLLERVSDECLQAAIALLEPDLREVIKCRLRGLRSRVIAERLGIPDGTVRTRLKRARAQLKVLLHGMVPELEDLGTP